MNNGNDVLNYGKIMIKSMKIYILDIKYQYQLWIEYNLKDLFSSSIRYYVYHAHVFYGKVKLH